MIDAQAVVASTANRQIYMDAFIQRARLSAPPAIGADEWYLVMDAGFSYVNEVCDAYVQDLFILNRDRDKIKSGLVILDKAANAIMFATGTSQMAMTIVAQAFGVASGATDVFANSYLYRIEPSNIQKLIKEAQTAYRAAAYQKARDFRYPTAVEQGIQGYLSLCLPVSIEARVNDVLNRTRLVGDTSQASGPVIDLIATTDVVRNRGEVVVSQGLVLGNPRGGLLSGSGEKLPKQAAIERPDSTLLNKTERSLSKKFFRELQATLCVTPDGDPGPRGSKTRQAISAFLAARGLRDSEEITQGNRDILEQAADETRDCQGKGFRNAFEVSLYGPAVVGSARVKELQNRLGVAETGIFDEPTRQAIARVRDPAGGRNGDSLNRITRLTILAMPRRVTTIPVTPGTPAAPGAPAGTQPAPLAPLVPIQPNVPASPNGSKKGGG